MIIERRAGDIRRNTKTFPWVEGAAYGREIVERRVCAGRRESYQQKLGKDNGH